MARRTPHSQLLAHTRGPTARAHKVWEGGQPALLTDINSGAFVSTPIISTVEDDSKERARQIRTAAIQSARQQALDTFICTYLDELPLFIPQRPGIGIEWSLHTIMMKEWPFIYQKVSDFLQEHAGDALVFPLNEETRARVRVIISSLVGPHHYAMTPENIALFRSRLIGELIALQKSDIDRINAQRRAFRSESWKKDVIGYGINSRLESGRVRAERADDYYFARGDNKYRRRALKARQIGTGLYDASENFNAQQFPRRPGGPEPADFVDYMYPDSILNACRPCDSLESACGAPPTQGYSGRLSHQSFGRSAYRGTEF